jgi:hypothetical protein
MTKTEQSSCPVVDAVEIFSVAVRTIRPRFAFVQRTDAWLPWKKSPIASSRTNQHHGHTSLAVRVRVMRPSMFILSAVMAAFWIYGLLGQL